MTDAQAGSRSALPAFAWASIHRQVVCSPSRSGRLGAQPSRADHGRYGRTRQRDIEAFAKERPVIELARLGRRPPPTWRTMLPLDALRASAARMRFPPILPQ